MAGICDRLWYAILQLKHTHCVRYVWLVDDLLNGSIDTWIINFLAT